MLLESEVTTLASIIPPTVAKMARLCTKDAPSLRRSKDGASSYQRRPILATVDGILDARVVTPHSSSILYATRV